MQVGGDVSAAQFQEAEAEGLRAKIQVLRRRQAYRNALDRFTVRSREKPGLLRETETAVVLPLLRQLRSIDEVFRDFGRSPDRLQKFATPEAAPRLRAELRKLFASVALAKGTRFHHRFPKHWAVVERLADKDLQKRRREYHQERMKLLDRRANLKESGKRLPKSQKQRLEELIGIWT
jgi:hypothetical protein